MGFGSYDESEQGNQAVETDLDENTSVDAAQVEHEGTVDFEIGASNDELLDRLQDFKEE